MLRDPTPVLHARVGALAVESWPLEQRLRSCWWIKRRSGFILESEFGPLAYGEVSVTTPTARPEFDIGLRRLEKPGYFRRWTPMRRRSAESRSSRPSAWPRIRWVLSAPRMHKPRLCRSPKADGESLGAEHLAEAWLRWALAESDSLTAEIPAPPSIVGTRWLVHRSRLRRELEAAGSAGEHGLRGPVDAAGGCLQKDRPGSRPVCQSLDGRQGRGYPTCR